LDLQGLLACGEARAKKMVPLFSNFQFVRDPRNPIFVAQQAEIDRTKREQSPEIDFPREHRFEVRSNND